MKRLSLLTLLSSLFVLSCQPDQTSVTTDSSPYCEDSAMAHFLVTPQRSLTLLDSAVIVKSLTPERSQFLKAIVVYNGLFKPDSCIGMCQSILDNEASWSLNDEASKRSFQVAIYRVMASASTSLGNQLATLRYAHEGARLAHGDESLISDEADMISRSGFVMCQTGQTDEGIEMMQRAERLAATNNTWSSLVTYFNNAKKLCMVLIDAHRYAEGRLVAEKALFELDELCQNPEKVVNIPEGMLKDSTSLHEFRDFNLVPLYAFMAYFCSEEHNIKEAELWLERFDAIGGPNRYLRAPSVVHPLILVGKYEEARRQIEILKNSEQMGPDRLPLLHEEQLLEKLTGNQTAALQIAEQITTLSDSLNQYNYKRMLADASTQYKLQEERQRREDSEKRQVYLIGTVILLVCVIVVLIGAIVIRRLMVNRRRLNSELADAQMQIKTLRESQDKVKAVSLEEMYKRVCFVVERYESYRDPDFDINALSQLVFSNRTYVSAAINQMSGKNFRTWLGEYRIAHAKKLLENNPELTIDQVATYCGYDNRPNFNRQFKSMTGFTPSEWICQQKGE